MFGRFSNAFDTLLSVQRAVDAANRSDFFEYSTTARGSTPHVNLFKNGESTVLTAEIPGVKKEDIQLEIKDNLLRIMGERKLDYPEKASAHRVERRNLKFDRTLKLPMKVDVSKTKADFENGILKIVLPMAESDKPKQITIS